MRPAALVVLPAILPSGCSEHLEFADWTIPVSEGTGLVEYRVVSLEEREAHIELQRDLVIRGAFGRGRSRARQLHQDQGSSSAASPLVSGSPTGF